MSKTFTELGALTSLAGVDVMAVVDMTDSTTKKITATNIAAFLADLEQTLASKTLTSPVLNGTLSGTAFLDEDDMASDSAIAAASQQSIKAYIASFVASGAVTFSNKNFSQDGGMTITDTGSTDTEFPLKIFAPNVPASPGTVIVRIGIEDVLRNAGALNFNYIGNSSTSNSLQLTLVGVGGGLYVDGSGNVGAGAASDGAKLKVTGTGEYTDTLTLSKASGNALVITADVDFNGNQDLAGTLDIGSSTTRRVAPKGTYVDNANGNPNISDTGFNYVNDVAEDAWESVGPTGGGADNTWTALDSVPDDAHWIEVSYSGYGSNGSGGNFGSYYVYARKNGSSEAKGSANLVAQGVGYIDASNDAHDPLVPLVRKIPISSGKFDLYWENTNYSAVAGTMFLIGYDLNP
jgi:hypothetical protein